MISRESLKFKSSKNCLRRDFLFGFKTKGSGSNQEADMSTMSKVSVLNLKLEQAQLKYAHRRQMLNSFIAYASAGVCVYIDQFEVAAAVFLGGSIYNSSKLFYCLFCSSLTLFQLLTGVPSLISSSLRLKESFQVMKKAFFQLMKITSWSRLNVNHTQSL